MADSILVHNFNGFAFPQAEVETKLGKQIVPAGYVNATAMCKGAGKKFSHWMELEPSKAYLEALSLDAGIPDTQLLLKVGGRPNGDASLQGTWVHPEVAIEIARWIEPKFAVWANRVIRKVLNNEFEAKTASAAIAQSQLKQQYSRILDVPDPWVRLFEKDFCDRIFNWFGCAFYWQYAYCELTPEEICKLDRLNPPVKGIRDCKIHQYLSEETRDRLKPYLGKLTALADGAATRDDFILGYARHFGGNDQLRLFK